MPDPKEPPSMEELLGRTEWARALARSLVGERNADDVVQEAWLSLLSEGASLAGVSRAMLRAVIGRRAIDLHRRDARRLRREERAGPRDAPETPDVALEAFETHRFLVEAVGRLAEPYRSTVILRYFEERSVREIAKRRSVPSATVRSWLARGLTKLREDLDRTFRGSRLAGILGLCALAGAGTGKAAAATIAGEGAARGIRAVSEVGRPSLLSALLAPKAPIVALLLLAAVVTVAWLGFKGLGGGTREERDGAERDGVVATTARSANDPAAAHAVTGNPTGATTGESAAVDAEAASEAPLLATIRGRVVLTDGDSLAGERIGIWAGGKRWTEIGENGAFEITAEREIRSPLVVAIGGVEVFVSEHLAVPLGQTVVSSLSLDPGAECRILCLDRETRAPILAAPILIRAERSAGVAHAQAEQVMGETGRSGEFSPRLVPDGHYMLDVKAPGYAMHQSEFDVPLAEPHEVLLDRAARLHIVFEGLERYPGVRSLTLGFFGSGYQKPDGGWTLRRSFTETIELGLSDRVTIDAPPPGFFEVTLFASDGVPRSPVRLEVPQGADDVRLTIAIPPEDGFVGRCIDTLGDPIHPANWTLLDGTDGLTDPDGRFVRPGLSAGAIIPWIIDTTGGANCGYDLGGIHVDHLPEREVTFRVGGRDRLLVEVPGLPSRDPSRELIVEIVPVELERIPLGSRPADPARSTSAGEIVLPRVRVYARTQGNRLVIPRLSAGAYDLWIGWGSFELFDGEVEIHPGDNPLEIPFVAPAVWEIRLVTDEGTPPLRWVFIHATLAGDAADVVVHGSFGVTEGLVRLEVPPRGDLDVEITRDGYRQAKLGLPADPGETAEAAVELHPLSPTGGGPQGG